MRRGDAAHARRARRRCAVLRRAHGHPRRRGQRADRPSRSTQAVDAGARFIVSPGFSDGVRRPVPRISTCRSCPASRPPPRSCARSTPASTWSSSSPPGSSAGPAGGPEPRRPLPRAALRAHRWHRPVRPRGLPRGSPRSSPSVAAGWSPPSSLRQGRFDEIARLHAEAVAVAPRCRAHERRAWACSTLRPAEECRYDLVALGEVMLRLDPGESRIRVARSLRVWEGGGEYNVARGLRKCFGLRTGVVTALADNEVGRLVEDLICQGGVDTSLVRWVPYDGLGRTVRNGLNFTERGFGVRGAVGVSDRGHTAASQMRPGRCRLGPAVRGRRCAVAAHRRHLRRTRRTHPRRGRGRRHERPPARHRGVVRPQLPGEPVEGVRRPGPGGRGQPAAGRARRRAHRQRRGLHRRARLRGAGRGRAASSTSTSAASPR